MAIGDFSRATHMSIKTLRHYHRVGLLEPADTRPRTPGTGAIRPSRSRRRRSSGGSATSTCPSTDIRAVLRAPDLRTRNQLISAHLARLEEGLAKTQEAVSSLRDLLADPSAVAPVSHRRVEATRTAAITGVVGTGDLLAWPCCSWYAVLVPYAPIGHQRQRPVLVHSYPPSASDHALTRMI